MAEDEKNGTLRERTLKVSTSKKQEKRELDDPHRFINWLKVNGRLKGDKGIQFWEKQGKRNARLVSPEQVLRDTQLQSALKKAFTEIKNQFLGGSFEAESKKRSNVDASKANHAKRPKDSASHVASIASVAMAPGFGRVQHWHQSLPESALPFPNPRVLLGREEELKMLRADLCRNDTVDGSCHQKSGYWEDSPGRGFGTSQQRRL